MGLEAEKVEKKGFNIIQIIKVVFERNFKDIITVVMIFLISFALGSVILTVNPVIYFSPDNMNAYIKANIIIARNGLPYFTWWHTPLYYYFLAIPIFIFSNDMLSIGIAQLGINSICVCLTYLTIRIKKGNKIALLGAFFYTTSYLALYIAHEIHEESLLGLFISLMFYFFFKYEKEKKSLWLWGGVLFLGAAFFTKEQVVMVLVIYAVYLLFWLKPKFKDLIISGLILGVFFGAFVVVEYLQDWNIIKAYLLNEAFRPSDGEIQIDKLIWTILKEPLTFTFSMIGIIIVVLNTIKNKKITTEFAIGVSVLFYLGLYTISRSYPYHMVFILFQMIYIASIGCHTTLSKLRDILKHNSRLKFLRFIPKEPEQAILVLFIPILLVQCLIFVPNLIEVRDRHDTLLPMFEDIASIVMDNKTYGESGDFTGYFIEDYYSYCAWYNSYKRHNFMFWSPTEVFSLSCMNNITDLGLKYFIYAGQAGFFGEIATNGSLTLVKSYNIDVGDYEPWNGPEIETVSLMIYDP
jgi:4-amino-4-deoxy-L-arabinose transferase-like glycosyltransferase